MAYYGLNGQHCLMPNGSIVSYDMFNNVTDEYDVDDIEELSIGVTRKKRGRATKPSIGYTYGLSLKVTLTDGEDFVFRSNCFSGDVLSQMLDIKEVIGCDNVVYTNLEDMQRYIDDKEFDSKEVKMLYELFDIAP